MKSRLFFFGVFFTLFVFSSFGQASYTLGQSHGNARCVDYDNMLSECGEANTTIDGDVVGTEFDLVFTGSFCFTQVRNVFLQEVQIVAQRIASNASPGSQYWLGYQAALTTCSLQLGF